MLLFPTLLLYALGLLLTGIGSRLASRCATWCGALCGLPMWMVGGTLVAVCTALPQLMLAFLAAGMSVTALAVGTALAGAVTQLGLVLALCLLRCNVTVDRGELLRKCALLLVACGVVAQIGDLSFSLIKREFGIKDYGHLFLEHGGVLDRFDSVLFVTPVIEIILSLVK